ERRLVSAVRYRLNRVQKCWGSKTASRRSVIAETRIRRMIQRVDDLTFRIEQSGRAGALIRPRTHRLAICEQQMDIAFQQRLRKWHQAFGRIAHTLDALSPLAVLERGYAICLAPDGRVVRSPDAVD